MSPRINSIATNQFYPPPLDHVVQVSAQSSDPAQRVAVRNNTVTISGTALNTGFIASSLTLSFQGETVRVPLRGGMTPFATRDAVAAALPEGYELRPGASYHSDDSVAFQIVKTGLAS